VWVSLNLFLRKVSPSPLNARWSKPLVSFGFNVEVSVGVCFLSYFPWESATLAFKRVGTKTLGRYDDFCEGLDVTLPRPGLKVGLFSLL
jgi:hypothetical protein